MATAIVNLSLETGISMHILVGLALIVRVVVVLVEVHVDCRVVVVDH